MGYDFFEHTADVKFVANGDTIENMLVSSSEALNEVIRGNIEIADKAEREFEVKGEDNMTLLYAFLEEFLVLLDKEDFLVSKVKSIIIDKDVLKCKVVGDFGENYKFTNDVKAVTYSDMFVREKDNGGFECQVVLDV